MTWKLRPTGMIQGRKRRPFMNMILGATLTVSMVICTFLFVSTEQVGIPALAQVLGIACSHLFRIKPFKFHPDLSKSPSIR